MSHPDHAEQDRTCVHCGKLVRSDREKLCNHCGLPFAPEDDPYEALLAGNPAMIVRTYRGGRQADTTAVFEKEAVELARFGYLPTTQSWSQGQWDGGQFVVALLLCIVLIGIAVFIYMLIVKPEGTLTVTYELRDVPSKVEPTAPSRGAAPSTVADRLRHLEELKTAGLGLVR